MNLGSPAGIGVDTSLARNIAGFAQSAYSSSEYVQSPFVGMSGSNYAGVTPSVRGIDIKLDCIVAIPVETHGLSINTSWKTVVIRATSNSSSNINVIS